jgi:DNA sulfur modification protein DndC
LLKKLLQAQISVRKNGPNPEFNLILPDELYEIRRIWQTQRSDWEDSVPRIYKEVTGTTLDWTKDDLGSFSQTEKELLKKICDEHCVPLRLVTKLMDVEQQLQGMTRRSSIYNRLNEVFSEDWMSEDEARQIMASPDGMDSSRHLKQV